MPYQVLARKWRPKFFADMIGQSHVIRALENSLISGRIHHAYLFSGTRGVGKTTVARVLARSLSCEQGISPTPCGECGNCQAIDEGRYVDLIEVDAASRTGVDDTRDLLDNVQYMPTQGRYKIYLIDEVHMFSLSSFNALLKTLEEPPPHIIFMLATTDPDKMPVTVLSRCLKFNLSRVDEDEISRYFANILGHEKITFDHKSVELLANAADGSVRDGLSLLDQAISHGGEKLDADNVRDMLGAVDNKFIITILHALADEDIGGLLAAASRVSAFGGNFKTVLDELARAFFVMSLIKLGSEAKSSYKEYAPDFTAETLQLNYQIALKAKQDLALAPDFKTGFEMGLIRMLAFSPVSAESEIKSLDREQKKNHKSPKLNNWEELVDNMNASPMVKSLAANCELAGELGDKIVLKLDSSFSSLVTANSKSKLKSTLSSMLGKDISLDLTITRDETVNSPALQAKEKKRQSHDKSRQAINNDPYVQDIIRTFNAKIDENSITETR